VRYDRKRFLEAAESEITAVVDRFGQVALLDQGQKLVCMFFAFRDRFAAWMPDGTRFGPVSLTGRSPTNGAPEKIGRALLDAAEVGGKQA
jgi:hypothetical protein